MDMRKLRSALLLPVVFLAGCGAAADPGSQSTRSDTKAAITFLKDTESAAKSYGQDKLGHFLKLDVEDLEKQGLRIPSGISLKVEAAHSDYCIEVANGSLSADSRWKNATVASGFTGISADDTCRVGKE
jgi:hypothetical protein